MRFRDRVDAGRELGRRVRGLDLDAPVVLALPRGGVPVAAEVAALLHAPLDLYRETSPLPAFDECDVVLVDDGLASGVTAEAALHDLRRHGARRLVLAAPVCDKGTLERIAKVADDVVCAERTDDLGAVGLWYEDFPETTDDEVREALERARGHHN
jgi:putative phosphoribosyl transferase